MEVLVVTAGFFLVFAVLREFVCWYFKINEHHRKMNRLVNLNIRLIKDVEQMKEKFGLDAGQPDDNLTKENT